MDDTPSQENPAPAEPNLNKLDLSQLQGFSFGTQWTQEKQDARDAQRGEDRPRREGGFERRDRRAFRKPAGDAPGTGAPQAPGERPQGGDRRDFRGGPRRDDQRGGPRRDDQREGGGERQEFRGQRFSRGGSFDRTPYDSPYFAATFYPEDVSFATLAKTIRSSCRTIELFEVARTVVGKSDRFVVVVQRKPSSQAPAAAAEGAAVPAVPGVKAPPLYISVADGLPFESEDAAISHVLQKHLDLFFETAEVEIDPPKGNYLIVNRCGVTGELLAPPNYHRYNQIVQQHFAARINRMPFEVFRAKIESVRDPEAVNQWLEKMRKITRYTWKLDRPAAAPAPAAPVAEPAAEGEAAPAPAEPAPAAAPSFDSLEDARVHLLTHARDKVVRMAESARFHGRLIEQMPQGEIRRAIEGTLERQRRFPLDTANALRGRLRREGFTIFKKGSKGVSYVCAVKRKFRVPGQTFSDSINALISFIETHPMVKAGELPEKFIGIPMPKVEQKKPAAPAAAPAPVAPVAEGEASSPAPSPEPVQEPVAAPASEGEAAPAPAAPAPEAPAAPAVEVVPSVAPVELTPEQREKIVRMQGDVIWLVREGYVTEFIDSRLFAPPPMVEARKKEVEAEEHDPENFPEAPAEAAPAPAAEASAPESEATPASTETVAAPAEAAPAEPVAQEEISQAPVEAAPAPETPAVPEPPAEPEAKQE
ncbi:MAG: hypothetical protein WC378_10145 [Opitutaceae bacterium]|jgi:hypothetical protein